MIVNFDSIECSSLAERLFIEASGIDKPGEKFERMRLDAYNIRKSIQDRIQIRAEYHYFDQFLLEGNHLTVSGRTFECLAFGRLDPTAIKGVILYVLSVGDYSLPEEHIMAQLYADIWGSSFTDAARFLFKDKLEANFVLSDSFGPGFYGMDVGQMENLVSFMNLDKLGMELRDGKILLPLKSCAGIYFDINDKYKRLDQACLDCLGTVTSCQLCHVREGVV